MRTVKIPEWMNPYKITINGKSYTYPAGATVEVEDFIAEAIEGAKFEPPAAPVRGILWKDITDRPFGEMDTGGDTLTWDRDITGRESPAEGLYKVSDAVPTKDELIGGTFTTFFGDEAVEEQISSENITELPGVLALGNFNQIVIVHDSTAATEADFVASEGIYFAYASSTIYASSIAIPGYTGFPGTKRLDEKYMPLLTSPNGTQYKLTVADDGTLTATAV